MAITDLLDTALDRSVVLGYTRIGSALRRRWWPDDPAPGSMEGKRVLVTGATSGIGQAMAGSFAALGASVHVLGRNADKLAGVARELRLAHPNVEVVEEVCDVGDLDAVRAWGRGFADRVPGLDGLVHNAGTITDERTESPQGHELQLAVHVLGPHVMTEEVLPALTASQGIVVWMSTGGMYSAPLPADPDGYEYRDGDYTGIRAYARTKRMQVVLAEGWSRRYDGTDVLAVSMHPGWVETPGVATHLPRFRSLTGPLLRTAEDGADTAVWLVATRPASYPAHFWHDRAQRPTTFGWQREPDRAAEERFLEWVAATTLTPPDWD